VGIAAALIMYIPQKLLKFGEAFDSIWTGFQEMFVVTAIVISAFVLQNANDALGLAPYVIDLVSPLINASFLPLIAFIVLLALGFVTGSFWGMAAVCFPIMVPLADSLGASMYLTIGAVIAGAAAGSTTCFYGDSVTLTCGLAKIKNIDYARTALPMILPVIIVTAAAYLIAGILL
jgi:Na+/H+ antiporter NhaC